MSAGKWIKDNLNTKIDVDNSVVIDWGNGVFTEINIFVNMFGDVIEQAIIENKNVRRAIADNDNGRGYKKLILT